MTHRCYENQEMRHSWLCSPHVQLNDSSDMYASVPAPFSLQVIRAARQSEPNAMLVKQVQELSITKSQLCQLADGHEVSLMQDDIPAHQE